MTYYLICIEDPVEYLAFTNVLYKYGKQCEFELFAVKNLTFHQQVRRIS